MKKNILTILVAAAAAAIPAVSRAQLNGSFESGTNNWVNSTGDSYLFNTYSSLGVSPFTTINPTAGSQFAVISDSGVNLYDGVDTETVSQTFTVSSAGILSLNYRFLTDGYDNDAYNPNATITLTDGAGTQTLASIARSDLPASAGAPLSSGTAYQVGDRLIGQNAWQTASYDVSSLVGQSVTLAFNVSEGSYPNDSGITSELAVDNLQVAPAPEPTTFAVLAGGFGMLALVNLHRKKS